MSLLAIFSYLMLQEWSKIVAIIYFILNIIFAAAVARDSGRFNKLNQKTLLVSGMTWAFATLMGGVYVAAIYWILHHSTLTRFYSSSDKTTG